MLIFILRRLVAGILTVASICVLGFFLLYLGAAGVARRIVGATAAPEIVARKEQELGLDRPLIIQFVDWASGALTGNLGRSWFSGQPVADALMSRLPVTLSLTIGAILVTAAVGTVIGVVAATRRGWADRSIQIASVVASAIPGFLVALVLVLVIAIGLRWVPATGYIRPEASITGWLSTIILPVIALSIGAIASVAQQVRGSMVDAQRMDYVRTLRARGIPHHAVVYRHVLRNASGPALSVLGIQFIVLFGGAVVVEQVFSLPGLGQTAVSATLQGDIPLVMGLLVMTALIVLLINLAVDLLQGWLNPKVRLS
ncbi:ABC transporter permease [Microbacterium sp. A196]|uniref:ABC transporter permease n=1 Tax=Microbacterium sp. A196 TaxID=3457320 RepID=UPI003FD6324A